MAETESRSDAARRVILCVRMRSLPQDDHADRLLPVDVVPAQWQDRAVVGLDGVVRVSRLRLVPSPQVDADEVAAEAEAAVECETTDAPSGSGGREADRGAGAMGQSQASAEELLRLARPFLQGEVLLGPEECLVGLEAMALLCGRLAAGRLHAAGELAARSGEELLASTYEVSDPGELSARRREQWRARSKIVAAAEVAALTGLGRNKARQLVAVALSPAPVRAAVVQGLAAGLASWEQVDRFWFSSQDVPHEEAAVIARALFATDVAPQEAAVERLDPEGELAVLPWQAGPFVTALRRLLTAARATDADGEAARRAQQRDRRDAFAVVDDDGSGQVVITGDGAESAACGDRLHQLAMRVKQRGDPRSLSQLRSDIARALLLHGTLPLGRSGGDGSTGDSPLAYGEPGADGEHHDGTSDGDWQDPFSAEEIASLARVLAGAPAYHLQVLVPWDTLTGRPALSGVCPCGGCTCTGPPDHPRPDHPPPHHPPREGPPGARQEGVSRVLGRTPLFLPGAAARALASAPGSTMSRVLFDPADGRCIERSVARYAPDAAMREQVLAADVTSRGYGSATLAREGQLDHVVAYLAGGATSEANLQALDLPFHARKTAGEWGAAIDGLRNITWTSFFGRLYRTRVHDYRQYLSTGRVRESENPGPEGGDPAVLRTADRRYLASVLTYAALTARQVGATLAAKDDDPDRDDQYLDGRRHPAIWVRRTRERDGRKVDGPRAGTPAPEQIIATPAVEVLRAAHWTDPFTRPEPASGRPAARAQPDDPPPF